MTSTWTEFLSDMYGIIDQFERSSEDADCAICGDQYREMVGYTGPKICGACEDCADIKLRPVTSGRD